MAENEEENARQRLAALAGIAADRANRARLTRLGGLTNLVYEVELGHERLCLRLPGPGSEPVANRRVEEANARAAASAGITPEIVAFGEDGAMLTRFVDGEAVTPEHLRDDPGALDRVGAALRALHDSPLEFVGVFRAFDTMQAYVALLEADGVALPAWQRAILRDAAPLRAALAAGNAPLRPCHCDPTGGNLIDTGEQVWLVDWEYSAMNDPAWDLAYFSVESSLDAAGDHALLQAYHKRPPRPAEAARLEATKASCELLDALWSLVQDAHGNRAADFRTRAERAFERVAARLAGAEFAAALKRLG